MLQFRPVTFSDKQLINSYLKQTNTRLFTYSFEVLYLWRDVYDFQIAEHAGMLLIKTFVDECHYFLFPAGNGDLRAVIESYLEHSDCLECIPVMGQITPENREQIESLFPGIFEFWPSQIEFEYIYETEKLASLNGKALQAKRNNINYFQKNHQWSFEEITSDNIGECIAFSDDWDYRYNENPKSKLFLENKALMMAFDQYDQLNLDGGCLRADGQIVALSLGCPLNDEMYLCLFERALHDMRGAYTLLNREFVRKFAAKQKYVNRAEDGGLEGLRQAKLSYNPAFLQEVYMAKIK
jgi:uncharacterized protein